MSEEPSKAVRIGLLGRGTVGGAFADLLAERADAVEAATGRRPEISGVLTRGRWGLRRDPRALRPDRRADRGHRPGARTTCSTRCGPGGPVVTANKQLLAQHGDELFGAAREAGVQLRFEAAVAGVIPIVRTIQESFGVTEIAKVFGIVNGTTNFILSEMAATGAAYEEVLARAQELGYAEADPTRRRQRRRRGGEDGDPRPPRLPHAGDPGPRSPTRGSRQIQPDDLAYAKELGLSLKLLGVAERREGGISVRVFPCFLYRRPPAGAGRGPVQRGDGRGAGDHRGDDVGPGRRRRADRLGGARRRRLDPRRRRAGARDPGASCRSSPTSPPPSTCTSRSPTGPGCWPRSPRCWATTRSR